MIKQKYLNWPLWCLISLGLALSFLYAGFSWDYLKSSAEPIFNSPDETANFYFAKTFAQTGQLQFTDIKNQLADGLIAPRSMRVIENRTIPAGFIGLPLLAGLLAKIFGFRVIFLVTPIMALLGAIF